MKKIILLIILLWAVSALGQSKQEFFINKFVEETNGVIVEEDKQSTTTVFIVEMPSFYDHEMVAIKLRSLVTAYSDVTVTHPWRRENDDGSLQTILRVAGEIVMFSYSPSINTLFIGF